MNSIKRLIPVKARHLSRNALRKLALPWSTYRFERDKRKEWDRQAVAWVQAGDYSELPEWEVIWRDFQSYVLPIASENNVRAAIDMGCGTGWLVRRLARVMDHVYGYDISPTSSSTSKKMLLGGKTSLMTALTWVSPPPSYRKAGTW